MITKKELPYPVNALEPYYSKETLVLHYDFLYKGYVDNTNKTQEKLEKMRNNDNYEAIKCLEKDLSFWGSGAILHELFFDNMAPSSHKTQPNDPLKEQIAKDFGSFEKMKAQFEAAAKTVEASRLVLTGLGSCF